MYFATAPLVKFKDVQKVFPTWLLYLKKSFVIDFYKAKIYPYGLSSLLMGIWFSTLKSTNRYGPGLLTRESKI